MSSSWFVLSQMSDTPDCCCVNEFLTSGCSACQAGNHEQCTGSPLDTRGVTVNDNLNRNPDPRGDETDSPKEFAGKLFAWVVYTLLTLILFLTVAVYILKPLTERLFS